MENESPINLKRFIPKKANKYYLLKTVVYTLLLVALGTFILYKTRQIKPKIKPPVEIKGVEIEIPKKPF